jgi:hypothetical protein
MVSYMTSWHRKVTLVKNYRRVGSMEVESTCLTSARLWVQMPVPKREQKINQGNLHEVWTFISNNISALVY